MNGFYFLLPPKFSQKRIFILYSTVCVLVGGCVSVCLCVCIDTHISNVYIIYMYVYTLYMFRVCIYILSIYLK